MNESVCIKWWFLYWQLFELAEPRGHGKTVVGTAETGMKDGEEGGRQGQEWT